MADTRVEHQGQDPPQSLDQQNHSRISRAIRGNDIDRLVTFAKDGINVKSSVDFLLGEELPYTYPSIREELLHAAIRTDSVDKLNFTMHLLNYTLNPAYKYKPQPSFTRFGCKSTNMHKKGDDATTPGQEPLIYIGNIGFGPVHEPIITYALRAHSINLVKHFIQHGLSLMPLPQDLTSPDVISCKASDSDEDPAFSTAWNNELNQRGSDDEGPSDESHVPRRDDGNNQNENNQDTTIHNTSQGANKRLVNNSSHSPNNETTNINQQQDQQLKRKFKDGYEWSGFDSSTNSTPHQAQIVYPSTDEPDSRVPQSDQQTQSGQRTSQNNHPFNASSNTSNTSNLPTTTSHFDQNSHTNGSNHYTQTIPSGIISIDTTSTSGSSTDLAFYRSLPPNAARNVLFSIITGVGADQYVNVRLGDENINDGSGQEDDDDALDSGQDEDLHEENRRRDREEDQELLGARPLATILQRANRDEQPIRPKLPSNHVPEHQQLGLEVGTGTNETPTEDKSIELLKWLEHEYPQLIWALSDRIDAISGYTPFEFALSTLNLPIAQYLYNNLYVELRFEMLTHVLNGILNISEEAETKAAIQVLRWLFSTIIDHDINGHLYNRPEKLKQRQLELRSRHRLKHRQDRIINRNSSQANKTLENLNISPIGEDDDYSNRHSPPQRCGNCDIDYYDDIDDAEPIGCEPDPKLHNPIRLGHSKSQNNHSDGSIHLDQHYHLHQHLHSLGDEKCDPYKTTTSTTNATPLNPPPTLSTTKSAKFQGSLNPFPSTTTDIATTSTTFPLPQPNLVPIPSQNPPATILSRSSNLSVLLETFIGPENALFTAIRVNWQLAQVLLEFGSKIVNVTIPHNFLARGIDIVEFLPLEQQHELVLDQHDEVDGVDNHTHDTNEGNNDNTQNDTNHIIPPNNNTTNTEEWLLQLQEGLDSNMCVDFFAAFTPLMMSTVWENDMATYLICEAFLKRMPSSSS